MQRTLARFLLIIACVLLQAYSSESGDNDRGAQARPPRIAIVSPVDGSAVTNLPAMLEVQQGFGRGPGRRPTQALLNGVVPEWLIVANASVLVPFSISVSRPRCGGNSTPGRRHRNPTHSGSRRGC